MKCTSSLMLFLEDALSLTRNAVRVLNPWLLAMFAISAAVMVLAAPDPLARNVLCGLALCIRSSSPDFWNSLLHTFASGSVLSVLFFWVLVELPRHQKRERLKRTFAAQYRSFKLQCIEIFLVLSESYSDIDSPTRLLDLNEFRRFFKEETGDHQNRWHRFLNGLNAYYLDALGRKMEHLRDELRLFLLAVECEDDELVMLLQRFTESTYYHVTRSEDYDEVKSLSGYFWELFAGWSFIEGYRQDDLVLEAIKNA